MKLCFIIRLKCVLSNAKKCKKKNERDIESIFIDYHIETYFKI